MMKRWRRSSSRAVEPIYTRARPGRQRGANGSVPDSEISRWLNELPRNRPLSVISLLGQKPDGRDEHSFYSFRNAAGFKNWLQNARPGTNVFAHPTTDFERVTPQSIEAIKIDFDRELAHGRTIVIVDSGGVERTRQVCNALELIEDPRSAP